MELKDLGGCRSRSVGRGTGSKDRRSRYEQPEVPCRRRQGASASRAVRRRSLVVCRSSGFKNINHVGVPARQREASRGDLRGRRCRRTATPLGQGASSNTPTRSSRFSATARSQSLFTVKVDKVSASAKARRSKQRRKGRRAFAKLDHRCAFKVPELRKKIPVHAGHSRAPIASLYVPVPGIPFHEFAELVSGHRRPLPCSTRSRAVAFICRTSHCSRARHHALHHGIDHHAVDAGRRSTIGRWAKGRRTS